MPCERLAIVTGKISERNAARLVNPTDGMDFRVLQDGNAVIGEDPRDFLRFAQGVEMQHRRAVSGESLADEFDEPGDRLIAGRQAILRQAERGLDDQDIGGGKFAPLGRGRLAQLEVTRIKKTPVAVIGQQHCRAEAVPGRIRGELHPAEFERLSIRHLEDCPFAESMLVEPGRRGRTEGQFVPCNMIGVGMRNKGPRLPSSDIDPQPWPRQEQPVVVVKHAIGRNSSASGGRRPP